MARPPPSIKPSPLMIPELLEEVVMHLPLRDILLCQRVDTHFRDVVQSSSNIKKVLFLEPATRKTAEWIPYRPSNDYLAISDGALWKISDEDESVNPLFNPFLASVYANENRFWQWVPFDRFTPPPSRYTTWCESSHRLVISRDWIKAAAKACTFDALETSSASYSRMLVTHPPCESLRIRGYDRRLGIKVEDQEPEESTVGVRFKSLLKTAAKVLFTQTRVCSRARPYGTLDLLVSGDHLWRNCPASVIDHVTGWEMLALMNNLETMDDHIDHIITARKKWDCVADENAEYAKNGGLAWESEVVEQDSLIQTTTAASGPW